jgi:CubicO group peptidase (beta-lactamase class C family)/uncharacterized protein YjbJ (UPF0337 family)
MQSQNAYLKSIADSCNDEGYVQEQISANFSYLAKTAIWKDHANRPNLEEIQAAFSEGKDRQDRIYKLLLRLEPSSLGGVADYLDSLDEERGAKSSVPKGLKITNGVLDPDTTKEVLQNFVEERSFEGPFMMSDPNTTYYLGSSPEDSERPRTIHSIGKVFTGVLISKMISKGLIPEKKLDSLIEIDEEVKKSLTDAMRDRLSKTTLRQAMTHQAGFGNYIRHEGESQAESYMGKARNGDLVNEQQPTKPEDFLRFADTKMCDFEPGAGQKYSDVGIIFAALSAQHHFNKQYPGEPKEYQKILEELVLTPAGITSFSVSPPENAIYDPKDPAAATIYGSPAGGYWMTPTDLVKFGKWFCEEWKDDSFRNAVNEYGGEFFNNENLTLGHSGSLPGDHGRGIPGSSAWFSVDPQKGIVVVMASNDQFSWLLGTFGIAKMTYDEVQVEQVATKVTTPEAQAALSQIAGALKEVVSDATDVDGSSAQPKSSLKAMKGERKDAAKDKVSGRE